MIDKIKRNHHRKHQLITYYFTLSYKYVKNELRILTSLNYSRELSKFSTVELSTVCRSHLEHTITYDSCSDHPGLPRPSLLNCSLTELQTVLNSTTKYAKTKSIS